jgi:hypothetical protein
MEKEQYEFNLEFHLLEWKTGFKKTWLPKEDVEELAQHLRDHFDELHREGHPKNQAWNIAIQAMGSHNTILKEFNKVWYGFMQNTALFYIIAFAPVVLLVFLARNGYPILFVLAFGIYALIYRTFVDYLRLRSKHIISKNQFWKLLIPGSRVKYFIPLYFS